MMMKFLAFALLVAASVTAEVTQTKPCVCTDPHPMNVVLCEDGTTASWKCVTDANNQCAWKLSQCPCERVCPSNCGFNPDYQCVTDPITKCGKCVDVKATQTPTTCPQTCESNCGFNGLCKIVNGCATCVINEPATPTPTPNGPVNCFVNPCVNASISGACPMQFCTPDYSTGCNFKCSKPDMCVQGGAPPTECSGEGEYEWDNNACKWKCKCQDCTVTNCGFNSKCITTNGCGKCVINTPTIPPCVCTDPHPMNVVLCEDGTTASWKCVTDANNQCAWKLSQCPCERVCPSNCGFNPDYQCVTDPITKCGKCVDVKATQTPTTCPQTCESNCGFNGLCKIVNGCATCVINEPATPTPTPTCDKFRGIACPDDSWECVTSPCPTGRVCIPERPGTCVKKTTPKPCVCTAPHLMTVELCADGTTASWTCVADANNQCAWKAPQCPPPVQCLMNPCDTPAAKSTCIPNSCVANYATGCNYDCKKCTAVARSITFTIITGASLNTAKKISNKMSAIAFYSDFSLQVYASMYIATPLKDSIQLVSTSGYTKTWTVTVNFKQDSCANQEANMNAFTKQLQKTFTTSQASVASIDINDAQGAEEQVIVDNNSFTTLPASDAAMAGKQACADGTEIDAAATCPTGAFELATPASSSSSSSSSSTPIAVIVAPIVGGVVLLAIIMAAVVVMRRRQAAQVKTITNVQQDTQMVQRV